MTEVPRDVFEKETRFTCRMNEEEQRRFYSLKQKLRLGDNNNKGVNKAVELALKFLELKEDAIKDVQHKLKYYEIFPSELEDKK